MWALQDFILVLVLAAVCEMVSVSSLLTVLVFTALWRNLRSTTIQTNIDVEEPSVIVSPSEEDRDYFGWEAIFHQLQDVADTDDLSTSLAKTRLVIGT